MPEQLPNTTQTRIDQGLQISNAVMSWFATITQRPIQSGPSYLETTTGTTPNQLSIGFLLLLGAGLIIALRK